jgi:hypothetical protein
MRRLVAIALLFAATLMLGVSHGEEAPQSARTMVVILDAVPYETVRKVIDESPPDDPLYAGFQPVRPLISTFPSSTSVAMVGLLEPFELPRSPGYEARFFDWDERKVRGGGAISFFRIDFAWREFFDWSKKGVVRSAIGGLRPVSASGSRLQKSVDSFFESSKDPYFIYLETTDLAAHMKGPEALEEVMVWLDEVIRDARERYADTPFRTVIFSDHGVEGRAEEKLENVLPAAREAVAAAGYKVTEKLEQPADVVLTPFGLVSSFEAYTEIENAPEVARLLAGAAGVDLCVHRGVSPDKRVFVVDEEGHASIERVELSDGPGWIYRPDGADPLGYAPIVARLSARRPGYPALPDAWWLEATAMHHYPDALHRIWRAFELVENAATILCSLEPGYMYGMKSTERLAKVGGATVRWTHGALHRDATLGFLLTNDERFGESGPVRFDSALVPLTQAREQPVRTSGSTGAIGEHRDKMPLRPGQTGSVPAAGRETPTRRPAGR